MDGKHIEAGGLRIFYRDEGQGQPLVLLHGGLTTSDSWKGQIETLAERYRVLAPDTRGHGGTDNPAGQLNYAQMADDVVAFCQALDIERPLIVGYSDGGQSALEIGLRHPGFARALVMGGTVSAPVESYLAGLRSWGFTRPGEADLVVMEQAFGGFFEVIKASHSAVYGPDYWRDYLKQISTLWLGLPTYSAEQLATITDPALVIMGDRDELGGVDAAARLFKGLSKGELSIITNADHSAVNTELFWDAVEEFLARQV